MSLCLSAIMCLCLCRKGFEHSLPSYDRRVT